MSPFREEEADILHVFVTERGAPLFFHAVEVVSEGGLQNYSMTIFGVRSGIRKPQQIFGVRRGITKLQHDNVWCQKWD